MCNTVRVFDIILNVQHCACVGHDFKCAILHISVLDNVSLSA